VREPLTELLYGRYPHLYRERLIPAARSSMAWGFQHGDGWFAVVDALSNVISEQDPLARMTQVKQDGGAMRTIVDGGTEFSSGAIAVAARFSQTSCERSGRRGMLMVRNRRSLQTLAPDEDREFSPVADLKDTGLPPPIGIGIWDISSLARRHATRLEVEGGDLPAAYLDVLDATLLVLGPHGPEPSGVGSITHLRLQPTGGIMFDLEAHRIGAFATGAIALCCAMSRRLNTRTGDCGPVDDAGVLQHSL
jgi:hypothetical protein